jgi:hypothetical protein
MDRNTSRGNMWELLWGSQDRFLSTIEHLNSTVEVKKGNNHRSVSTRSLWLSVSQNPPPDLNVATSHVNDRCRRDHVDPTPVSGLDILYIAGV